MIGSRRPGPRASWPALLSVLLGIGLIWPARADTLDFTLSNTGLTPEQRTATQALLDTAASRLPARWRDALDQPIAIEWRDDLPEHVHGRAYRHRILLRRSLLDGWMADAAPDATTSRAALAAVLHELAHLYDRTPRGRLSRDPRLLDLAGWQVSALPFARRRRDNAFTDRTPDRYELTNPREFVAVNLEHYLLDADYACRRPALQRHFAAHFGAAPLHIGCAPGLPYLQAFMDAGDAPLLQIDPARVYGIDYLLAEGNQDAMSRWGHSMLRLVICAPGRVPGPACRLDLQHHRVLSFRAFVDDVQISSWRGLTGSYPSRLFVLPLEQVIDEYAKVELRGLQSIPLRLQADEVASLLEQAAQQHWSYDGRYYFVSNNCASETWRLLHDGVPRLAHVRLRSITPTGLLKRLKHAGVADASVLADPAEARRLGYYFEPMSARYQAMFDVARDALALPQTRVQDWLALPPATRAAWLPRADLRTAAALLVLENAALRRHELLARDELKQRWKRLSAGDQHDPLTDELRDLLQLEGLLSRPAALLSGPGYGLPQADERALVAGSSDLQAQQWRQRHGELRTQARLGLSPQRQAALRDAQANINLLGAHLRQLNHDAEGLALPAPR